MPLEVRTKLIAMDRQPHEIWGESPRAERHRALEEDDPFFAGIVRRILGILNEYLRPYINIFYH